MKLTLGIAAALWIYWIGIPVAFLPYLAVAAVFAFGQPIAARLR